MVMQEEMKTLPFGDIWAKYCEECGVSADESWFEEVLAYEKEVLANR
jgi:L-rhamnose isomerase